jgi:hypothetical protein
MASGVPATAFPRAGRNFDMDHGKVSRGPDSNEEWLSCSGGSAMSMQEKFYLALAIVAFVGFMISLAGVTISEGKRSPH